MTLAMSGMLFLQGEIHIKPKGGAGFTITRGSNLDFSVFGFNSQLPVGSVAPAAFDGHTIVAAYCTFDLDSNPIIVLALSGNVPQAQYASWTVVTESSQDQRNFASSATYEYVGGGDYTFWTWLLTGAEVPDTYLGANDGDTTLSFITR